MKRTLSFMVMALALLLTQCRKPSIEFPTPSETTTVSMTITAGPGSKTDISTEGVIVWSENDKIYVGDGSKYVGCLSIVSGVGNATGTFTGDVTVDTGGDCTFHFYYLGHDNGVAPADGAKEVTIDFSSQDIYADGGKLKNASGQHVGYGKVEHVEVEADKPVTGLQVSMKSKVAIAYFCFQKGESATPYEDALTLSGDHIYNKMTVNFGVNDFSFSGTNGDISLADGHSERYVMLVPTGTDSETLNFGGAYEGTTTLANGIEANKFYRVDGSMPIVVKVEKVKPFTVGMDNGKPRRVEFSPGNLYYDGTTDNKWKFEANQYDFRTCKEQGSCINGTYDPVSGTPANDWGLFGWSTSKTTYGMSSSTNLNDYLGDFVDWGKNAIGTYAADTWRTLTNDEWNYLLSINPNAGEQGEQQEGFGREDALKLSKWSAVTFGESGPTVYGLIIMPDGWKGTLDAMTGYTAWQSLESSGAVFLPAAGSRFDIPVTGAGSGGYYWSSTPKGLDHAYLMFFSSGYVYTLSDRRDYGLAVRLVR